MGALKSVTLSFKGGAGYVNDIYGYQDAILQFSPASETWSLVLPVAFMREPRGGHTVSVVNFEDFEEHCDFSPSRAKPRGPPVLPPYSQNQAVKQRKKKNRTKQKKKEKQA